MNETFSQHDLAKMFGVTRPTIRRWWAAGLLPAPLKTPAGVFRWLKSDIEKWIEQNRVTQEKELQNAIG